MLKLSISNKVKFSVLYIEILVWNPLFPRYHLCMVQMKFKSRIKWINIILYNNTIIFTSLTHVLMVVYPSFCTGSLAPSVFSQVFLEVGTHSASHGLVNKLAHVFPPINICCSEGNWNNILSLTLPPFLPKKSYIYARSVVF